MLLEMDAINDCVDVSHLVLFCKIVGRVKCNLHVHLCNKILLLGVETNFQVMNDSGPSFFFWVYRDF